MSARPSAGMSGATAAVAAVRAAILSAAPIERPQLRPCCQPQVHAKQAAKKAAKTKEKAAAAKQVKQVRRRTRVRRAVSCPGSCACFAYAILSPCQRMRRPHGAGLFHTCRDPAQASPIWALPRPLPRCPGRRRRRQGQEQEGSCDPAAQEGGYCAVGLGGGG